jgi:hypothetical protein
MLIFKDPDGNTPDATFLCALLLERLSLPLLPMFPFHLSLMWIWSQTILKLKVKIICFRFSVASS